MTVYTLMTRYKSKVLAWHHISQDLILGTTFSLELSEMVLTT